MIEGERLLMKNTHDDRRYSFCVFFILLFTIACSGPSDASAGTLPSETTGIPRLVKQGTATQLVVDGKRPPDGRVHP